MNNEEKTLTERGWRAGWNHDSTQHKSRLSVRVSGELLAEDLKIPYEERAEFVGAYQRGSRAYRRWRSSV
jgi:hypothetical protein